MADEITEHPVFDYVGYAEQTLAFYAGITASGDRTFALRDLLADLMHWCDAQGVEFDEELSRATQHYFTEGSEHGRVQSNVDD